MIEGLTWPLRAISETTWGCRFFFDNHILIVGTHDREWFNALTHEGGPYSIRRTDVRVVGVAITTIDQDAWLASGPRQKCGPEVT